MEQRFLGRSGLELSVLGFGAMTFGDGQAAGLGVTDLAGARRQVDRCIDAGINLFDTADIYSRGRSEEILGEALGDKRSSVILATKAFGAMGRGPHDHGLSRRHLIDACDASLRRLGTDWIDLYQLHCHDALVPIEETLRALDGLVRQGKVRYVGNSNFPAWRIAEAELVGRAAGTVRFVSCQDEYSLLVRGIEKDLLPAAQHYNLGLLPFFPLASGLLTGKYQRGAAAPADTRFAKMPALRDRYVTPRNEDIVEKLDVFAKARGRTMLELAFSWLASRPQVSSVIAGATRVEQIEANVKAIDWALTSEDLAEIDTLTGAA